MLLLLLQFRQIGQFVLHLEEWLQQAWLLRGQLLHCGHRKGERRIRKTKKPHHSTPVASIVTRYHMSREQMQKGGILLGPDEVIQSRKSTLEEEYMGRRCFHWLFSACRSLSQSILPSYLCILLLGTLLKAFGQSE